MGVTGLWSVVDSVGHPINLETLNNKVIAIDISVWIHQSIKGFRTKNGESVANAHVLSLFHRICKLLFYKIKPVFVFDGRCPELKKNTISKRAEQRTKAVDKSRQLSLKVLKNYISLQLPKDSTKQLTTDDCLPSLESSIFQLPDNQSFKIYQELSDRQNDKNQLQEFSDDSDDDIEPNIAFTYNHLQDIDSIDFNSTDFKNLPPNIRYELLNELKQKYKGYRNMDEMPKESNDFSSYQMQRLIKKRSLQSKIEDTINQLNGQHSEDIIENFGKKDFCFESKSNAGRLMSDENTRYLFLKKSQTNSVNTDLHQKDNKNQLNSLLTKETNVSSVSKDKDTVEECIIVSDETSDADSEFECIRNLDTNKVKDNTNECNYGVNCIKSDKQKDEEYIDSLNHEIDLSDKSDSENEWQLSEIKSIVFKNEIQNSLKSSYDNEIKNIITGNTNNFTKIKTIEVNSDSNDDDFEVCSENRIKDNNIQNIIDGEKCSSSQRSSQLTENESKVSLKSNNNNISDLSKTSSSKSIELNQSESSLRKEIIQSMNEMYKQNRLANHTTDQMMKDCQQLLQLFGIPYVLSPTEAEAQCATLEELGLTDGTITDDSDVLLFGAQTVYKNFFTTSKYVELFKASDIESRFGLSRSSLICIAMLCGSDYTDGVNGVGAVTAVEILSEFPGDGIKSLINFKDWLKLRQTSKDKRPDNSIRKKFLKLKLNDSFPNRVIFDAYMNPTVDKSKEKFLWSIPRLDELRDYTRHHFGWSLEKTDSILLPIMKKVNEKQTQMTIDSYFKIQVQTKYISQASKRLNTAINKLSGKESIPVTSIAKTSTITKLIQKVKNQRKRKQTRNYKNDTKVSQKRKMLSNSSKPQNEINLSESSSESE
ncbi:DNA excision repair protein ERCC-5-like [Oppia nitens]|uniref:DNA excision repair protein ERCC-5-like n=1 Tax=Oppia nitens TaxID=1686743 RepID=UPI0023DCC76B|nr:DNA excision repair protein ERCC-5-like [Oppia nitens]